MTHVFNAKERSRNACDPSEYLRIGGDLTRHQAACIADAVERFGGSVADVLIKSGMYFEGAPCLNCLAYGHVKDGGLLPGVCAQCSVIVPLREWRATRRQRDDWLRRSRLGKRALAALERRVDEVRALRAREEQEEERAFRAREEKEEEERALHAREEERSRCVTEDNADDALAAIFDKVFSRGDVRSLPPRRGELNSPIGCSCSFCDKDSELARVWGADAPVLFPEVPQFSEFPDLGAPPPSPCSVRVSASPEPPLATLTKNGLPLATYNELSERLERMERFIALRISESGAKLDTRETPAQPSGESPHAVGESPRDAAEPAPAVGESARDAVESPPEATEPASPHPEAARDAAEPASDARESGPQEIPESPPDLPVSEAPASTKAAAPDGDAPVLVSTQDLGSAPSAGPPKAAAARWWFW